MIDEVHSGHSETGLDEQLHVGAVVELAGVQRFLSRRQSTTLEGLKSTLESLRERLKELHESDEQLEETLEAKSALQQKASAEGLDTSKLLDQIGRMSTDRQQIANEREDVERKIVELEAEIESAEALTGRVERLCRVLREKEECSNLVIVDGWSDLYRYLRVDIGECDDLGQPQMLRLSLNTGMHRYECNIAIRALGRFVKGYLPPALKWALVHGGGQGRVAERDADAFREQHCAFFDVQSSRFVLWNSELSWYEQGPFYNSPKELVRVDFGDVALSIQAQIEAAGDGLDKVMNLEECGQNDAFAAWVRERVDDLTTTEPRFHRCSETLVSEEIHARIGDEWNALIAAPWSKQINGDLALLKHHLENGERARFWSGEYQGLYGFRLRTRDHSWLVGDVYIDPSVAIEGSDQVQVLSQSYTSSTVARVGRMTLRVENTR